VEAGARGAAPQMRERPTRSRRPGGPPCSIRSPPTRLWRRRAPSPSTAGRCAPRCSSANRTGTPRSPRATGHNKDARAQKPQGRHRRVSKKRRRYPRLVHRCRRLPSPLGRKATLRSLPDTGLSGQPPGRETWQRATTCLPDTGVSVHFRHHAVWGSAQFHFIPTETEWDSPRSILSAFGPAARSSSLRSFFYFSLTGSFSVVP